MSFSRLYFLLSLLFFPGYMRELIVSENMYMIPFRPYFYKLYLIPIFYPFIDFLQFHIYIFSYLRVANSSNLANFSLNRYYIWCIYNFIHTVYSVF
jgi:hypothetical protein